MKKEKIILRGVVTPKSLSQMQEVFQDSLNEFHITFENIDTVSKEVIEWLLFIIHHKKPFIKIFVTQITLHSYLNSFQIPCELLNDFFKKIPPSLSIEAIAIGGSAGSNTLIEEILTYCAGFKVPIFIAQHISEEYNDIHTKLFQHSTTYDLHYPKDGEPIKEKTVYIAPPNHHMSVKENHLVTDIGPKVNFARPSISVLFESLSNYYGSKVLTVITCGYGKDGSDILNLLAKNNTPIIIQNQSECNALPLVQNAIDTGYFNHILKLKEIKSLLDVLIKEENDPTQERENFLKAVFEIYGYDFRGYNQNMVERRIQFLIDQKKIHDKKSFYRIVLLYPDIYKEFFFAVAISVTEFFRKPPHFQALKNLLLKNFHKGDHLKIWVAGCSSGEEAYSVAILLKNLDLLKESIIYATDFNSINIEKASNALYETDELYKTKQRAEDIIENENFLDNFQINGKCGAILPSIRKKVLFFEHNLVSDSYFNEFSIILCQNVLIYFDKQLQEKVIKLFYDSLPAGGFLQIGAAERIPSSCKDLFDVVDIKNRIYRKKEDQ